MTTIRETFLDRVVHCKVAEYSVYIGRPGKWGNPFKIGVDGTRLEVVQKYLEWLLVQKPPVFYDLVELHNQVLGCFCAPLLCHGHVLAALAEQVDICLWCGEPHYGGPEFCRR